jgi:hypothetical protein
MHRHEDLIIIDRELLPAEGAHDPGGGGVRSETTAGDAAEPDRADDGSSAREVWVIGSNSRARRIR